MKAIKGVQDLKKEIRQAHSKEVKRMKAEILACLTSIVKRSAVDTGRYRSNWLLSINQQNNEINENIETEQSIINKIVSEVMSAPRGDVVYFFQNNLAYAPTIEYEYQTYAGRVREDVDILKRALQ